MCTEVGSHFISKMEQSAAALRRLKSLHYSARQKGCAIIPVCSRDVTLGELGIVALRTKFSPGTLQEASLFLPIAQDYKSLFWDTVRLASARLDITYASEAMDKSNSMFKSTSTSNSSSDLTQQTSTETSLPKISLPSSTPSAADIQLDRLVSVSSLDNVSDASHLHLSLPLEAPSPPSSSSKLKSKAKSYGDLSHFDAHSSSSLPLNPSNLPPHRLVPPKSAQTRRKLSRQSLPPIPKPPLLPTFKQVLRSSSTACSLAVPTESSLHPVVQSTLENVPVRLCPAPRSITPFALSSTYSLPEGNHGLHRLESHHIVTTSFGARFFFLFFRLVLLLFLIVPLARKFLALFDTSNTSNSLKRASLEQKARLKYYLKKSPATLPPSSTRKIDPKFDRMSCNLPTYFKQENAKPLVVGGIGTTSAYLASSSHQSTTKLHYVEVRAPRDIPKCLADVICVSTCAIALATNSEDSTPSGVMPPLSAGGKRMKDWLIEEGFTTRFVSFGLK